MSDDELLQQLLDEAPDPASFLPSGPEWVTVLGGDGQPSSNVHQVIFWPDAATGARGGLGLLGVRFYNGGEYHYLNVPENVWRALMHADSKGKAHWDLIRRMGYTFRRIKAPERNWKSNRNARGKAAKK
jgi:hypothetical protein